MELGIFTPTETTAPKVNAVERLSVELSKILLTKQQPRRYFDPDKMQQLVQSVQEHGILEPLLVRPLSADTYELVAGERRYRAAKEVGLKQVPVVVRELTEHEALQLALIENLQREDLNPVEETEGIIALLSIQLQIPTQEVPQLLHRLAKSSNNFLPKTERTQLQQSSDNVVGKTEPDQLQVIESIFKAIGTITWESFASHRLPLLNLPELILEALREGKIEYTKARAIVKLTEPAQQQELLNRAIDMGMSLSQIRAEVAAINCQYSKPQKSTLKNKFNEISSQLKKSKVWNDQKKQKRLEKLLVELESLMEDS